LKKNQINNLDVRNIIKIKQSMDRVNNLLESAKERLSKLEDGSVVITHNAAERYRKWEYQRKLAWGIKGRGLKYGNWRP
jgi:hypothetical protein